MLSHLMLSAVGFIRVRILAGRKKRLPQGRFEHFVNEALARKLTIWDIRRDSSGEYVDMCIALPHFFKLRPLLKQTGSRIRILERRGLPFMVDKLLRRKVLAFGVLAFLIGLYTLSSVVWQVTVSGTDKIPEEDVLLAAKANGIHSLQWKFRLDEPDVLAKRLQTALPGTSWVGVEVTGTRVHIKVIEATIPEKKPLLNPRHIIADSDAVISEIQAERGRPLVQPNQHVRKGDILISGILGDEEFSETVVAKGEVRGLVWHQYTIEAPLTKKYKVFTGDERKRFYVVFGDRGLQLTGYGKLEFSQYESLQDRNALQWREWVLPIGWMNETLKAYEIVEQPISEEEAKAVALEQARADVLQKGGEGAAVRSENILHEKSENGKVYMTVLFEVEENITAELPIVPEAESQAESQGE
ncbi:sporulation protein YqfD [Paenibacillus turpanensis]|uniref:sporulation protein YqfD n=1 Tax=Paenibacillus turpanensis TaxID=2689078 RepID=UPI001FB63F30|nr:sporulation protein YqfD [Paenibacillus turpanensis]